MATKEVKIAAYQAIKDNLVRRLKTLEKQKSDPSDFYSAQTAYFKYTNGNVLVSRIISGLMLEGRIYKPAMKEIFNASVLTPGFKNEKVEKYSLSTPPFWSEELENRYGLRKELIEMMRPLDKNEVAPKNSVFFNNIDDLIDGKYALKMMPIMRHLHDEIMEKLDEEIILIEASNEDKKGKENKNYPKTIYLVTKSIILDSVIFFVIDDYFEMPVRFTTVNNNGKPTYITKLYNIAYLVDVPGKKVTYDEQLADDINNGPFRRKKIRDYLKSNKLDKPTLVKKSEDGKILVLNNDTLVKNISTQQIPTQFRYLYLDKTK